VRLKHLPNTTLKRYGGHDSRLMVACITCDYDMRNGVARRRPMLINDLLPKCPHTVTFPSRSQQDVAAFIKREFDKKYNPTW
jgi:hypothetical protein